MVCSALLHQPLQIAILAVKPLTPLTRARGRSTAREDPDGIRSTVRNSPTPATTMANLVVDDHKRYIPDHSLFVSCPREEVIEAYHQVHSANHAAVSEALQRAPAPKHKHVAWELHQYLSHEAMLTTERETVASHERFVMQFCQMLRRFVRCTDVIEGFAVVVRAPSPTP